MKKFKEPSTSVLAGWISKAMVTFKCCADVTVIRQEITCKINGRETDFAIEYYRNGEAFWFMVDMNGITVQYSNHDVIPSLDWWFANFEDVLVMLLKFFRGQNLHQHAFKQTLVCTDYDDDLEPEYYRAPWEYLSGVEIDPEGNQM